MGWASGSELYDEVMDVLCDHVTERKSLVRTFADKVAEAFEDYDWDTQDDSRWYQHLFIDKDGNDTRRDSEEV